MYCFCTEGYRRVLIDVGKEENAKSTLFSFCNNVFISFLPQGHNNKRLCVKGLTLYHMIPIFNESWKELWLPPFSPFLTMFSNLSNWLYWGLTNYHTMTHFDALKIYSSGKHCNKQILLFSHCFLPYILLIFHFKCTLKCCLQFVSIWTSLNFYRLVMG